MQGSLAVGCNHNGPGFAVGTNVPVFQIPLKSGLYVLVGKVKRLLFVGGRVGSEGRIMGLSIAGSKHPAGSIENAGLIQNGRFVGSGVQVGICQITIPLVAARLRFVGVNGWVNKKDIGLCGGLSIADGGGCLARD